MELTGDIDTMPLLHSVVTPCLNEADVIETCLGSVAEQTAGSVEHIIVDGGSDDGTQEILDRWAKEDHVRWFSEEGSGLYEAIESGFETAEGQILSWLNADDRYFPWTTESVRQALSREGTDWVTGVPSFFDGEGGMTYLRSIRPYYRRKWIRRGWYHGDMMGWIQQESTFWTEDLWHKAGGFPDDVDLAGDYLLWRRFAGEAELETVPVVLAGFSNREGQLSDRRRAEYIDEARPDRPRTGSFLSSLRIHEFYNLYRIFRYSGET